jgi:hypothetical protein
MADYKKDNVEFVEELEHTETLEQVQTMGTVKLSDGAIIYIPSPTADPQGQCVRDHLKSIRLTSNRSFEHACVAEVACPGHHFML